ncbi:MAG: sensor histidine kinase, partial [Myxococcaceae bacterium]|nr:sensor histidine kinase [Myxococcaceae bacterium]
LLLKSSGKSADNQRVRPAGVMPSRHSTLAPKLPPTLAPEEVAQKRTPRAHARPLALRPRIKPKRDALTRVRHDLRSLVHSVVGYSDLLAEPHYGSLSAEQARFVNHVRSAAEQLQELVDTCIELSRPDNDQFALELPEAPLGQLLRRVRNTLTTRGIVCDLTLSSALESRMFTLDIVQLERALVGLSQVLTREGAVTVALRASELEGRLVLSFQASDAGDSASSPSELELLEDHVGNRDFVRLKLSEVLLSRARGSMMVGAALDSARVTFPMPH